MSSSIATHLKFSHSINIVRALLLDSSLHPIAGDKLQFYGLYKQATEGDVNIPRPSSRQVVEYAKWKAWNRMRGFGPIEAQNLYVESLIQLLTEMIYQYPKHEHVTFMKKALNSLQENDHDTLSPSSSTTPPSSHHHYPLTPMTSPGVVHHHRKDEVLSEPSTLASASSSSPPRRRNNKPSNRALEKLQLQVMTLAEQIDRLRTSLLQPRRSRLWRILTLLFKHFIANSVILCLFVLYFSRRKTTIKLLD